MTGQGMEGQGNRGKLGKSTAKFRSLLQAICCVLSRRLPTATRLQEQVGMGSHPRPNQPAVGA